MLKKQTYIGWDVGGAHLKIATLSSTGQMQEIKQVACPLWQGTAMLEQAYLSTSSALSDSSACHSVTMSGELVDYFDNRVQGVRTILDCMRTLLNRSFLVYAGDQGLVNDDCISGYEQNIASMNWHATVRWLSYQYNAGVLVDMGSTTTDLVPFKAGRLCIDGYDDVRRLASGELVYTGISRTPVMAVADSVYAGGIKWPIVAELFANTADVYRVLGQLPKRADLYPTCDNGDKTVESSARRLERMFGCDWDGDLRATSLKARAIANLQQRKISEALLKLIDQAQLPSSAFIIGAGTGYQIIQAIAERLGLHFVPYYQAFSSLSEQLYDSVCDCATAVSVASLAHRQQISV